LVFISAAEPSADLHGAALIRATQAIDPSVRFVGVAGPRMAEAGCERIFDMSRHAAMLLGVITNAARGVAMLMTCDRYLRRYPFAAAVVIDSPMLHLPLAAKAQSAGVPVLYYIAPQMWAWGKYRIHKLRNRTDRVAVILPFEEEFFRNQGVNATYVGHPLAEQFAALSVDRQVVDEIRGHGVPVVALLPGSRKHVVEAVLPGQLQVARRIASAVRGATFGVSVANREVAPSVARLVSRSGVPVEQYPGHHAELIQAADLVLVASGTTALEVAFHERAMIVMYNTSRFFYHAIGRWMIDSRYLSLPNILAGREIVPEFMPYYTSTAPIADRAIELLQSEASRKKVVADLAQVVARLRGTRAAQGTAELLVEMISRSRR
jgi:lipid-A-disaccharide synthase